ncbi:hypothetical protein WA556_007098 [Blastocystis sp. ATCC 50177/Nand II]
MNGLKIAFLHPDLGIGGAERLIVDAAVGLQQKGHDVTVFTSHHGVKAFDETKDGTLKVITHGDFLPRTVFNRFYIFFAIIRAMYLAFVVALKYPGFDVIVCDQNAAYIPILRLLSKSKVVFYCHHPDYVQTPHNSLLKILYRLPFDLFEEYCVSMADSILVNSYYTQSVYKRSFRVISYFSSVLPSVLYPCVDYTTIRQLADKGRIPTELKGCRYFVSVNRYEHKKEVEKAILGFSHLRNKYGEDALQKQKLRLVIVGGYDPRLSENVDYFRELNELAMKEGVTDYVLFIRNCSQEEKAAIIKNSIALIYTPKNEHFGIVPLEGMALGRPVIADNSGGPKESIVPGLNGFLCDHWEDYGIAMGELVEKKELGDKLGAAGSKRVEEMFSFATFSDHRTRSCWPSCFCSLSPSTP